MQGSNSKNTSGGFTLIELAVVIVIIGILMAALIPVYENYYNQTRIKKLEANMGNVRTAFADFIIDDPKDLDDSAEARYPRPARSNAATGSAGYGIEIPAAEAAAIATGSCSNGICVAAGKAGRRVLIGAVPTRTLQIGGQYMSDTYGDRLTYAVTEDLTQANAMSTMSSDGAITMVDESGPFTSDAQFALVSHGKNARGGFKANGQANGRACTIGKTGEGENCDNDATFRYAVGEVSTKTPEFYDDKAEFTLIENDDDQWWRETSAAGLNIVNRNTQSVGIGFPEAKPGETVLEPTQKLDVIGSIRARQDILADLNVTAIKNITAGQNVIAQQNVSAGVNVTARNDVIATNNVQGNNVNAQQNVTAGQNVTANANVTAAASMTAGQDVGAGNNLTAGNMTIATGFFYRGGSVVGGGGTPTTGGGGGGNANCPDGQYMQGINNGVPICKALPAGSVDSTKGDPLYANKFALMDYGFAAKVNDYLYAGLMNYFGSASQHFLTKWNECRLRDSGGNSAGQGGEHLANFNEMDMDGVGMTKLQTNDFCVKSVCYGRYNKFPSLAQSSEGCVKTPGDPICSTSYGITFDCFNSAKSE